MKSLILAMVLSLVATQAMAQRDCEELKKEISVKLEVKGVKNFTLEVVPADKVTDQKVVGTCEAGGKKIIYKRD